MDAGNGYLTMITMSIACSSVRPESSSNEIRATVPDSLDIVLPHIQWK